MEAGTAESVDLRDMHGPTALTGGWRRFLRLLWLTTKTDFRMRYERTVLGYAWSILGPLLLFLVLYIAFTRVIRFGNDVSDYPAILLMNIMLYFFFAGTTGQALNSVVTKAGVIRKVSYPLLVAPMACVLGGLIQLGFSLIVVLGFWFFMGVEPMWSWLLFPAVVLGFTFVTTGASLFVSAVFVKFRDLAEIWRATTRAMFYATPVLFPIEFYPEAWHFMLFLNPLAPLLAEARVWMVDPNAPTYTEALGGAQWLIPPIAIAIALFLAGVFLFRRQAPKAAEQL